MKATVYMVHVPNHCSSSSPAYHRVVLSFAYNAMCDIDDGWLDSGEPRKLSKLIALLSVPLIAHSHLGGREL